MKKHILLLLLTLLTLTAAAQDGRPRVLVIPIEREIDMAAARQFRSGYSEAVDRNFDYILLKLNTYGGALDAADSIRTGLMRSAIPTIAFVDNNAASAGALIALACDSVFMAPGSTMGSATVVNGQGEPMPQKYQSYMMNMMRSTAEHHGRYTAGPDSGQWRRSPEIAAAMVMPDTSLSLTAHAAMRAHFAEGIAESVPQVLEQLNMPEAVVETYRPSLTDTILGILSSAAVRAILVTLILGGIYMEMHTPGLGFAAAVACVAAALYFLPMVVSATLAPWILILLIVGIALIALEVFVVPGFGVTGICGIIAIGVALVAGAMSTDGITGFSLASVGNALTSVLVGAVLAVLLVLYLTSSRGPKFFRRHTRLEKELKTSEGYVGVDMSPAKYIGQEGRAETVLRPAGKISIGSNTYDAVSTGEFISPGKTVKVVKYENAQLYVVEVHKS